MPQVLAITDTRVASLTGHIVLIEANVPTEVPDTLYQDALQAGCMPYTKEHMETLQKAITGLQPVAEETPATTAAPDEPITPATSVAAATAERNSKIRIAILRVMDTGEPKAFKNDGCPTVHAVRTALNDNTIQVKAGTVYDIWSKIDLESRLSGDGEAGPSNN